VRNNRSHHNYGPGFWTDINNIGTLYEYNTVEDNFGDGISHEIGYDAIIRYNTSRRNGRDTTFTYWTNGACIQVQASRNVEVHNNTCVDNLQGITGLEGHRGSGIHGTWELVNLNVHHNNITSQDSPAGRGPGTGRSGVVDTQGTGAFQPGANNRFNYNTYTLGPNAQYFIWNNGEANENQWVGFGQDMAGTFQR
jgi:hypothetical protein